ncbi:MAG TPA: HAMP domain-containing sensor histidine kinase [Burkholderiales bacterium]
MRTKAIVSLALLVLYLVTSGIFVAYERQKLFGIVQQMEQIHAELQSLARVRTGVTHSIATLEDLLSAATINPQYDDIRFDIESIEAGLAELREQSPETAQSFAPFERNVAELKAGRSRDKLIALRDSEQVLVVKLDEIHDLGDDRSLLLLQQYRELNRNITLYALCLFLLGLGAFGAVVAVFFTRLSGDIGKLEARSAAVVNGYRGAPLAITRHDEVGGLMQAVNQMQEELFNRERQQEISRQQLFHREKMAAVGALAAAVAHEVNNPINAIAGIAQHTLEAIHSARLPDSETLRKRAQMTLEQTERIGGIMRQLADLSAPRSPKPELLNVNDLAQATCSFIRYDRRFRGIDLVLDLDRGIPAVRAVSDHLTQVLMNLLINASDAMEGVVDRKPAVHVSTRALDGEVLLSVSDNGQGMDAAVLSRAFEQSFTTKPSGKGRGIGLYLCKALVEETGGRIELQSAPGAGTVVRIRMRSNQNGRQETLQA